MVASLPAKHLQMFLITPLLPIRVSIGTTFPIAVEVTTSGVGQCEVALLYDHALFAETSGQPNPRTLTGAAAGEQVRWELRAVGASPGPVIVQVDARADGCTQRVQLSVEVT